MAEQRAQRRLAAILAADVVGYSRLMEQDEAGTMAALADRRKAILEPLLTKYHGRIVRLMGDGTLAEFASAVDAVQCAVDIQKAMKEANAKLSESRALVLRVGLNLGDVIVEGSDIYGDGVNVAARLEAMADPGGIYLSDAIHQQVERLLPFVFRDLGNQELKNIARAVRVYSIVDDDEAGDIPRTRHQAPHASAASSKPSIAVLPFTNMSGDPGQQYFSDGITEDIITELSRFRDLFVIARHSCFQYRDKALDVKSVGRELGARFVLEGSFRRSGSRVRISAQLIDAETGNHLWAERYDRDLADMFILQEELAHTIAATIGGRVDAAGRDRATRLGPAGLKAYDLILRGEALQLNFNRIDMEQAHALALRAIEIDPTNARAHVLYASCCFNISAAHWTAERDRVFEEAVHHARRAVALDNSDSVTQHMLGFLDIFRREYEEARIHCEKALESNPNDTDARTFYALLLIATGQPDAAIEQLDLVKRHNPFDLYWVPWVKGIAFFTAHRYEEAIAVLKQIPEPINEIRGWLAASYAQAGRLVEAKARLDEFLRVAKHDMVVYPGDRLKDWEPYWHAVLEYRDQRDFDHLFEGLRRAGMPE